MGCKKNRIINYYVEGECEDKFLKSLISESEILPHGKIKVWNVVQNIIPPSIRLSIAEGSIVVFVFDTDTGNYNRLLENVRNIQNLKKRIHLILIPQVRNFEDELLRSCSVKNLKDITNSKSTKDFKRDFIRVSNLHSVLEGAGFDFSKMWIKSLPVPVLDFHNGKKELTDLTP